MAKVQGKTLRQERCKFLYQYLATPHILELDYSVSLRRLTLMEDETEADGDSHDGEPNNGTQGYIRILPDHW